MGYICVCVWGGGVDKQNNNKKNKPTLESTQVNANCCWKT